jgi:hypothetical protein
VIARCTETSISLDSNPRRHGIRKHIVPVTVAVPVFATMISLYKILNNLSEFQKRSEESTA